MLKLGEYHLITLRLVGLPFAIYPIFLKLNS